MYVLQFRKNSVSQLALVIHEVMGEAARRVQELARIV